MWFVDLRQKRRIGGEEQSACRNGFLNDHSVNNKKLVQAHLPQFRPEKNLTMKSITKTSLLASPFLVLALSGPVAAADVDAGAAEALMKKSGCFKCHALDKKKDGPSFKETAAKLKGKPNAEKELFTHLTTNPKVKVDGKEEEHANLKTKNEADVRNVVGWILTR